MIQVGCILSQLHILLKLDVLGLYQCVAVNSMGRVWTAARISVHHRFQPTPPKNVQCRPYDATSICLNWTASSNVMAYSIYSTFKCKLN